MATDPINDATAKALAVIDINPDTTPEQKKNEAINKSIVESAVAGFNAQEAYSGPASSDFQREKASKYDLGYTQQQGDIGTFRAGQQSGWDQFGNKSAAFVPQVGLGIVELGGHILDIGDNIYGMVSDGDSMFGGENNFDNFMSEWARDQSEALREMAPVYRKNPEKTWDMGDSGWWMDATFDTAESIAEFLITGAGVAKVAGAVSKGVGIAAKSLINSDVVGAGIKMAEKAAATTGRVVNSAITSESIAALNASQSFKAVYEEVLAAKKEDGTAYTEEEAKAIASNSASTTFRMTLATTTLLNITSLAPFAKGTPKKLGISAKGTNTSTYLNNLKDAISSPAKVTAGQKAFKAAVNFMKPSGVFGEMIQEGTEEVFENLATDRGKREGQVAMGKDPDQVDLFSDENGLAFALGAMGGGFAKAAGSTYKTITKKDAKRQSAYEQMVQQQIDAVEAHMGYSTNIQNLQARKPEDLNEKEYIETLNEITDNEIKMVSNTISAGLANGTIRLMEQDMANYAKTDSKSVEGAQIDKASLKALEASVVKHRKMIDNLASSPIDARTQRKAINASIRKDLYAEKISQANSKFADNLTAYTGDEVLVAKEVNMLAALEASKREGNTTPEQNQRIEDLKKSLSTKSKSSKNKVKNSSLVGLAAEAVFMEQQMNKAGEDYEALNNPDTSENYLADMDKDAAIQAAALAFQQESEKIVSESEKGVAEAVTGGEIDVALKKAKSVLKNTLLSKDQKEGLKVKIDALEKVAAAKKTKLQDTNKTKNTVDNANPDHKTIAAKIINKEELTPKEVTILGNNLPSIQLLAKKMETSSAPEADPSISAEEGVEPTQPINEGDEVTNPPSPEDLPIVEDKDLFGVVGKEDTDTAADDKVSTERPPSDELPKQVDNNPKAAEELEANPPTTVETVKNSEESIPGEDFSTKMVQLRYYKFLDNKGKEIKNPAKQLAKAKSDLSKWIARDEDGKGNRFLTKKIALLADQIKRVELGLQDKIFMPRLDNNMRFESKDLTDKRNGANVTVDNIFESVNGILSINTTQVMPGQEVDIVYDPDWPYFMPTDVLPVLIYRVIDGKRQSKPIAELPFQNIVEGSEIDKIRKEFARGRTESIKGEISSKNYGDAITESKPDGSRAENPLSAAVTSQLPVTLGYMFDSRYKVENYNPGDYTDTAKEAISELNDRVINNQTSRTMGMKGPGRIEGTHFIATVAPNGKLFPTYIDARNITENDANKLLGKGENNNESRNMADILSAGVASASKSTSAGIVNLKKLMAIGSTIDSNVEQYLLDNKANEDRKSMLVTSTGILWKTDMFNEINPNIPKGSWIRIDYRIPEQDFNPLSDMLIGKNFSYQILDGNTFKKIAAPGGENDYHKAASGSSEFDTINKDLRTRILNSKYNISKDFMNTPRFIDAFGENTEKPYNEYIMESNMFSTDMTTNVQKFHNASIRVRKTNTGSQTDAAHDIQVTPAQEKKAEKTEAKRIQIAEESIKKENAAAPQPTENTPVPDQAGQRELTNREKARRKFEDESYMRQPNNSEGFSSMSKAEVAWLTEQIGSENLSLVKGVDRVLTVGGREALGYFHNGMVKIAELAETGTGYHEAFHFVFHMALNSDQRGAVIRQARKKYGKASERNLEESLAEDFRAYMLESDKIKRPNAIARLFKNLLAYIEKIIGINPNRKAVNNTTDILSFYDQVATGEWKQIYKDQFGEGLNPTYRRYKLVKGLSSSAQQMMINHSASEIIAITKDMAKDYESFSDVISNRSRLNTAISILKDRFNDTYITGKVEADRIDSMEQDPTDAEDALMYNNDNMGKVLDSWENTPEQNAELNPPVSFRDELVKSLSRFGFQVSITTTYKDDNKTKPADLERPNGVVLEKDTEPDPNDNDEDKSDQDHIYNQDVTMKDTKKTISGELKRRLSLLPLYKVDNNGDIMKDEVGEYVIEKNVFGSPILHDFNTAYSNIKSALADTAIDKIYETITLEAKSSPLFAAIEYNMNKELSKDSTAEKYWDGFMSEFMSSFNNSTYNLVTVKSGGISKSASPELIFIDRATIYKRINDTWQYEAQTRGLVDIEFNPIKHNWEGMYNEYQADLGRLGSEPKIGTNEHAVYENNAIAMIQKYTKATGLTLNPKAMPMVKKNFNNSFENALRGKRSSLEAVLDRGRLGNEKPFGKDSILNGFSKAQGKFENDINSGTVFANGKQLHSLNMPSFISDMVNGFKDDAKNGTSEMLSLFGADKFYVPRSDNNNLTNKLIDYWSNPSNLTDAKITQFFDFKDGKDSKEYDSTNTEQSFVQKIIAGVMSGKKTGHFSLGTLSDKLKSIGIELPIANDIDSAKDELLNAYSRTVYQEGARIHNIENSNEFAKRYRKKDFVYLPELNDKKFAPLKSRITEGDMTSDQFNQFFANTVTPALKDKIDTDLNIELERLFNKKILAKDANGEFELSASMAKHLNTTPKAGMPLVTKFIIEDRMWKMEMSKVFMGDLAKYKNFWDYFKRMYQTVTPGRKTYVNNEIENASHRESMTRLIIKTPHSAFDIDALTNISDNILSDPTQNELARETIENIISQETESKKGEPVNKISDKDLNKILSTIKKKENGPRVANAVYIAYSYRSNNRGDAASYVSIDFFRDQKKGIGSWNGDYEWVYNNVWNYDKGKGRTVEQATAGMSDEAKSYYKAKDTKLTADALKPFYYGPRLDTVIDPESGNKIESVMYEQYKDSMMPILPIWGKNVSGFSWMLDQFKNKVDVISTEDTVKQGLFDQVEMPYTDSETGEVVNPDPVKLEAATRRGIKTKYLRYPQVPAKIKDTALAGTQLEKIIMSNLSNDAKYSLEGNDKKFSANELSNEYHEAFSRKIKSSYNKMLASLGLDGPVDLANINNLDKDKKRKFLTRLRNITAESVISQGKSESYIDALNIKPAENDNYEYDLGMGFDAYSRAYQNTIMSLVRSNVLRQEAPGGSMVNMADLSIAEDDTLKFIHYDNGKIQPAEIAMPHVHAKKIGVGWGITTEDGKPTVDAKGNVLRENLSEEQLEALKVVIYRIPTQMKSSTLPTIIKRIMPPSDGAKIMIPGEMTTQAGLDFDFDKSYMMMKVFGEDTNPNEVSEVASMNKPQLDNYLFDIHWAVLTNGAHFEEMVTPVSSRGHDQLIASLSDTSESKMDDTNVFNSVTNIEMESLSKHSHVMRGTFSKFAGGHNVMTNIVTSLEGNERNLTIDNYISTNLPIYIESGTDYKYDTFGNQRDSEGKYISENHSENLNSALDSQNDPKLGRLNTSTFNSFATGYMIDLGVPDRLVKKFMNTPVIKKLSDEYFRLGGMPYVMTEAVRSTIEDMGMSIKRYKKRPKRKDGTKVFYKLNEQTLDNPNQEDYYEILAQFVAYNSAASEMAKINEMLSPETQKPGDAAGMRTWNTKKKQVLTQSRKDNIIVNTQLFNIKNSPIKKIAAFHEYGMDLSNELLNNLFPYFTSYYNENIDTALAVQGKDTAYNWKMFDEMHRTMDMISLAKSAESRNLNVLNMISPGFLDRLTIYKGQEKPTVIDELSRVMKEHPSLKNNEFISALVKDKYNHRNETQLLNFPNSTDNNEQQKIIADFDKILKSNKSDVRQLGNDLIAYTVATSGFTRNNHSFVMMVPTSFWNDSGIASLMKEAKKDAAMFSSGGETNLAYEQMIRSLGPSSSIIPAANLEEDLLENDKYGLLLSENSAIVGFTGPPLFFKMYDKKSKKYELYKALPGDITPAGGFAIKKLPFFGEAGRSNEIFSNPNLFTKDASSIVPDSSKDKVTDKDVDRIQVNQSMDNIPDTDDKIEKENIGLSSSELNPDDSLLPDTGEDMNKFFSLEAEEIINPTFSKELEASLDAFLSENGITVEIIEKMEDRFGLGVDGVADALNQAIFLAKGEKGRLTKPEEVAHIYIESTLDSRQTQKMIAAVDGTQEYEQVKEQYSKRYKNDDSRLRREAAAKILAKQLIATDQKPAPSKIQRAIDSFMNMIKRLFGTMNVFEFATERIMKGQVVAGTNASKEVMFNLAEDSKPTPIDPNDTVTNEDDVEYLIEEINRIDDDFKRAELNTQKAEDQYNTMAINREIAELENIDLRHSVVEVGEAIAEIKHSISQKIKRLHKQAKTAEDLGDREGLGETLAKMESLDDIGAMGTFLKDTNIRIEKIGKFYQNRLDSKAITEDDIYEMSEELNSFGNVKFVTDFMEKSLLSPEDNKKFRVIIQEIDFNTKSLSSRVSTTLKEIMAPVLNGFTTEDLTNEKILEQFKVAPKDVSFLSKWLISGIDSIDLLVRLTQKIINDAKYEAEAILARMVNKPGGLKDAEINYEKWAKSQGIDIGNMANRNEMFIELVEGTEKTINGKVEKTNDKWYLVNKRQGSEKYNEIMSLEDSHPAKVYYQTLVKMYMGAQTGVEASTGRKPFGYQLPRLRKNKTELVSEGKGVKGIGNAAKEFWRSMSLRKDDDEQGYRSKVNYGTDENGDIIKDVPIYFKTKMDASEVSLDISTSIKGATSNMLQHAALSENKAKLWAIEKIANERKVEIEGKEGFVRGRESNIAQQIELIKNQHLYGESKTETKFTVLGRTFDLNGLSKFLNWFTSFKIMPLNFNIAFSNAITGNIMLWQEALGGEYFSKSNLAFSSKLAIKEFPAAMADMYQRKKTSKMGVALEFLNLENDFKTSMETLGQRSAGTGKAIFAIEKSTRFLQESSQSLIMTQTVGAMMDKIKFQDANGKEVSMWDSFTVQDGNMSFQEGLTYNGDPVNNDVKNKVISQLRNNIVHTHEKVHGVYNRMDAPAFSASILGQQMMFFRGWLINPLTRRFQGGQFSERTGGYDEGTYRSMATFAKNVFGPDGKLSRFEKFSHIVFNSHNKEEFLLSKEERDNLSPEVRADLLKKRLAGVKKTRAEITMFITFFLAAMAINAFDDEDEEERGFVFDITRYHILRAKREMMFYSPWELAEIIKNPSISSTVVRDGLNLIWKTMSLPYAMATGEGGEHFGKMVNKTAKMVPIVTQFRSFSELSRAADAIESGFR